MWYKVSYLLDVEYGCVSAHAVVFAKNETDAKSKVISEIKKKNKMIHNIHLVEKLDEKQVYLLD